MLIHTSVPKSHHEKIAGDVLENIQQMWFQYRPSDSRCWLTLWKTDFSKVSAIHGKRGPMAPKFPRRSNRFIVECLAKGLKGDSPELNLDGHLQTVPIYVVNSDFDRGPNFVKVGQFGRSSLAGPNCLEATQSRISR